MAYDAVNVIPTYYTIPGDVGSFNQQYYIGYVGGQLRTTLEIAAIRRTIDLTFQGDWGATSAYNVDHHISGYEPTTHRYTMESTSGGAVHLALIAETAITKRFSVGLQADHMAIYTTGTHHFLMYGAKSDDENVEQRGGGQVRPDFAHGVPACAVLIVPAGSSLLIPPSPPHPQGVDFLPP